MIPLRDQLLSNYCSTPGSRPAIVHIDIIIYGAFVGSAEHQILLHRALQATSSSKVSILRILVAHAFQHSDTCRGRSRGAIRGMHRSQVLQLGAWTKLASRISEIIQPVALISKNRGVPRRCWPYWHSLTASSRGRNSDSHKPPCTYTSCHRKSKSSYSSSRFLILQLALC